MYFSCFPKQGSEVPEKFGVEEGAHSKPQTFWTVSRITEVPVLRELSELTGGKHSREMRSPLVWDI